MDLTRDFKGLTLHGDEPLLRHPIWDALNENWLTPARRKPTDVRCGSDSEYLAASITGRFTPSS